jgi:hypothetical protein
MKKFLEQERANKKLCIDCHHSSEEYSRILDKNIIKCGLLRSTIDDSPLYICQYTREQFCRGDKWKLVEGIEVVETKEEADSLNKKALFDEMVKKLRCELDIV